MNLFSLGGFFSNIWMDLWVALNSVVYQVIEWLYEVFEAIANVNLFSKEAFNDITSRLYVVIGIAMLFIFAYNIILMIINPDDKKSTGNTGKVVKETIIALVLVILLPRIFNYMSIFQRNILDSHILEQIILGNTAGTEVECDFSDLELIDSYVTVDGSSAVAEMTSQCNNYQQLNASQKGAYLVAPTIFTAFFHPTNYGYNECVNYLTECKGQGTNCVSNDGLITTDDDKELCAYYVYDTNIGQFKGGIANFMTDDGVYSKAWSDKGIFDFNYLMAFVAGILAVIMFFRYSLAIGVRVAKLGFFQIISPIPVMMRIIPKQKEAFYDKWFKHLVEEYLDVFVRLAIIYFALFAISLVPDVMDSLFASLTGNIFTKGLAAVVVILGILKFAGDAPDLIKEFFGSSGRYALKGVRQQLNENKLGKQAIGYVGGSAIGAASAIAQKKNPITGFIRGGRNTAQSMGAADLTKKDAFTDAIKTGKQVTDLQQSQANKYVAFAKNVASGETKKDFISWLKNESVDEINSAASGLYSAFGDLWLALMKQWVDQEAQSKTNYQAGDPISLGNDYYTRKEDGRWYKNGTTESLQHNEMETVMKDYFKSQKSEILLQKLKAKEDVDMSKLDNWTNNFMKAFEDKLPKLGTEFSEKFFKEIESVGGFKVSNLDELQAGIKNLRNNGDAASDEKLTKIYVQMESIMKDKRDSTFKSYGDKKN